MGAEPHDQEQWRFPDVVITEEERREVVATVVGIATKVLFSNHLYTFGNKVYRQRSGGAIGLRATCAIARVTMNVWDKLWGKRIEDLNLRIELYTRYMDDGRIVGYTIRPGWRFEEWVGQVLSRMGNPGQGFVPNSANLEDPGRNNEGGGKGHGHDYGK